MRGKVKIVSVIACIVVILICCIYYPVHISNAVYDIELRYKVLEVEDCSATIIDAAPEGYYVNYYGNEEELAEMEVAEVTWQFFNNTNSTINLYDFRADYRDADGHGLYEMKMDTEDLAVSIYENKKIIPPGEQASLKAYVLVPKGMHEIEVKPGYLVTPSGSDRESFTITF